MDVKTARFGEGGHPKRHYYTVKDIAKVTGRAVGTIRNDSWRHRVDLDDLGSVLRYCRDAVGSKG